MVGKIERHCSYTTLRLRCRSIFGWVNFKIDVMMVGKEFDGKYDVSEHFMGAGCPLYTLSTKYLGCPIELYTTSLP